MQADFDVLGEMRRRRASPAPPEGRWPWPPYPIDARARIFVFDGAEETQAISFRLHAVFPRIDRLRDGRWIVADSRCRSGALNAQVFAPDGTLEASFSIGDGISHLQADSQGGIWVGYFDEGVFGAEAGASGPPLGQSGLNRFDAQGALLWAYDAPSAGLGDRPVYDCEALNVAGDAVWCCADSPMTSGSQNAVMRFRNDEGKAWGTDIFIAEAIAVQGDRASVIARVYDAPLQLTEFHIDDDAAVVRTRHDLADAGIDVVVPDAILGRGPTLHVVDGLRWWRIDLAD